MAARDNEAGEETAEGRKEDTEKCGGRVDENITESGLFFSDASLDDLRRILGAQASILAVVALRIRTVECLRTKDARDRDSGERPPQRMRRR